MTDTIALRGIHAFGRHGANPGEKGVPQAFDIDVLVGVDLGAARRSDRLADTVDYDALHRSIVRIVQTTSYDLLERIAQDVLDLALRDERISWAEVSIGKPKLLAGATPVVTVRQTR